MVFWIWTAKYYQQTLSGYRLHLSHFRDLHHPVIHGLNYEGLSAGALQKAVEEESTCFRTYSLPGSIQGVDRCAYFGRRVLWCGSQNERTLNKNSTPIITSLKSIEKYLNQTLVVRQKTKGRLKYVSSILVQRSKVDSAPHPWPPKPPPEERGQQSWRLFPAATLHQISCMREDRWHAFPRHPHVSATTTLERDIIWQ